jgi:L-alanine-DL-glutamate epimerase-like enolase superfamily enzyme
MKIKEIEVFHISIPFAHAYKLSKKYGTWTNTDAVIVKITTDENVIGWGEANPQPPFTEETVDAVYSNIVKMLAPAFIGKDPTDIAQILAEVDSLLYNTNITKSAIDLALHDLVGKIYNLPVYALLGGKLRSQFDIIWPFGAEATKTEDEANVKAKIKEGYSTFAVKLAAMPLEYDINRLKDIEDLFGNTIKIFLDSNQGWTVHETLKFIEAFRHTSLNIILLEQPINRYNTEGLSRIRSISPWPINMDESLFSIHDAANLITQKAADGFAVKISKNGGIASSKKIANLAEAYDMPCFMNSMADLGLTQAASLHVGCTLPNIYDCGHSYMSVLRMGDDITDFASQIKNGVVTIKDAPGLGVTVNEDKIAKYTVKKEVIKL